MYLRVDDSLRQELLGLPPHLLFGPVNRWSYPALITSISPSGTDGANVEAVNYAPEVYAYDNATPPA